MQKRQAVRGVLAVLFGCLVFHAVAADPSVSDVAVRQRWPWSRLVDISYVLNCEDTQKVDVAVAGYSGVTPVSLPLNSLSGDLHGVSRGERRLVWDPTKTAYTNELFTRFSVEITPTAVPVYMIVDLTNAAGTLAHVEYVYPGDPRLETYGRWTNVWFGVTNSAAYMTDKLVLRRVPAGSYMMGESPGVKPVTLTRACYAGVFELTEAQWNRIMQTPPYTSALPKGSVTYNQIRGATNAVPPVNWYATGSYASPASCIGRLRAKTGIDFDLPTEAQWQYLCRAGTTSYFNDGVSVSATETNILNELAWWKGNSGAVSMQHQVGGKTANAWGLYDMHGNVWEFCLDWHVGSLGTAAVTDPQGPASGTARVACGGTASLTADGCRSASRGSCAPATADGWIGLRLVRTLP